MKKFLKVLQGIGLATAGTILAQPELITSSLTPATQTKVAGLIAIASALLPSVLPKKKPATPTTEE